MQLLATAQRETEEAMKMTALMREEVLSLRASQEESLTMMSNLRRQVDELKVNIWPMFPYCSDLKAASYLTLIRSLASTTSAPGGEKGRWLRNHRRVAMLTADFFQVGRLTILCGLRTHLRSTRRSVSFLYFLFENATIKFRYDFIFVVLDYCWTNLLYVLFPDI